MTCSVYSFGYLHLDAPVADLGFDVRRSLLDPAVAKDGRLLGLTGKHPDVVDRVMRTPGATAIVDLAVAYGLARPDATIAFGCAGGRHRSVALAEAVAARLGVVPRHLHVHLDRVLRT